MLRPIDAYTLNNALMSWYNDTEDETEKSILRRVMQMVVHAPTLPPPNEALTLEQLQEMDGEPVYSGKYKRWFLVTYFAVLNRSQLMDSTGTPFVADDCGPLYLCPPEGEEN